MSSIFMTMPGSSGCYSTAPWFHRKGCSSPISPGPASDWSSSGPTRRSMQSKRAARSSAPPSRAPLIKENAMPESHHSAVSKSPGSNQDLSAAEIESLASDLAGRVRGEVRFSGGDRALYAADASNYRQVPIGVVIPKEIDDVIETIAVCRQYGVPVLPRGGGTSLAGQCCNVAVVIDFSKYLRGVLEVAP